MRHLPLCFTAALYFMAPPAHPDVDPLIIAVPDLEPFVMLGKDGEQHGMYIDYLEAIFGDMEKDYSVMILPANRLLHALKKGSIDAAILSLQNYSDFDGLSITSESLLSSRMVLMSRLDDPSPFNPSIPRDSTRVAVLRNNATDWSKIFEASYISLNSRKQLLKVLFTKRVEFIIAEEAIMKKYAHDNQFPELKSMMRVSNSRTKIAFSRKSLGSKAEILASHVSGVIERLREKTYLTNIERRYNGHLTKHR